MGLDLSDRQIAAELDLAASDVQSMTEHLRNGRAAHAPAAKLDGRVEIDEGSVVAGHKGQPAGVVKRGGRDDAIDYRARQATARWKRDKPPILGEGGPRFRRAQLGGIARRGVIQRGRQVVLHLLPNVQQVTIRPIINDTVASGTLIQTDEYDMYARLPAYGYGHKTVCQGNGEYARDEDGDGFCEVHVNTIEGFRSLLRSWLRPHRGVSQDKLPLYLGFFQFVYNTRQRGKALLGALVEATVR